MKALLVLASAGGSELPWWTPLAVVLALLAIGGLYHLKHRDRDSGIDTPLQAQEESGAIPGPTSPSRPEAGPTEDPDPPAPRFSVGDLQGFPARS